MSKTGVAIITCDRVNFFNNCLESITNVSDSYDFLTVVNDGDQPLESDLMTNVDEYINNETNQGVGVSKNHGLESLMRQGCEHLFIVEDDVVIHDPDTLNMYIHTSEVTGIKHLNFCLHGEDNKIGGVANPKLVVDYGDLKLSLYHNVYGAVSYYHKQVIQQIGLMDTIYRNAMEHVDHTMLACEHGFHPPFRWFADVFQSDLLIHEQDTAHSNSKIRSQQQWIDDFNFGINRFYDKFNVNVCDVNQSVAAKEQVIQYLKQIKS